MANYGLTFCFNPIKPFQLQMISMLRPFFINLEFTSPTPQFEIKWITIVCTKAGRRAYKLQVVFGDNLIKSSPNILIWCNTTRHNLHRKNINRYSCSAIWRKGESKHTEFKIPDYTPYVSWKVQSSKPIQLLVRTFLLNVTRQLSAQGTTSRLQNI